MWHFTTALLHLISMTLPNSDALQLVGAMKKGKKPRAIKDFLPSESILKIHPHVLTSLSN